MPKFSYYMRAKFNIVKCRTYPVMFLIKFYHVVLEMITCTAEKLTIFVRNCEETLNAEVGCTMRAYFYFYLFYFEGLFTKCDNFAELLDLHNIFKLMFVFYLRFSYTIYRERYLISFLTFVSKRCDPHTNLKFSRQTVDCAE